MASDNVNTMADFPAEDEMVLYKFYIHYGVPILPFDAKNGIVLLPPNFIVSYVRLQTEENSFDVFPLQKSFNWKCCNRAIGNASFLS
jgi:hypothetical protein